MEINLFKGGLVWSNFFYFFIYGRFNYFKQNRIHRTYACMSSNFKVFLNFYRIFFFKSFLFYCAINKQTAQLLKHKCTYIVQLIQNFCIFVREVMFSEIMIILRVTFNGWFRILCRYYNLTYSYNNFR